MTGSATGWPQAGLTLLLFLTLMAGIAACSGPRALYPSGYRVPPEAPPHPLRRPLPPAGFQASPILVAAAGGASKVVPPQPFEISGNTGKVLSPIPAATTGTSLAIAQDSQYRVQLGDTLYAVSRQSNVPIRAIIDANGLTPPFDLQAGQVLKIPRPRIHQVAVGDTVYGISRRYGVEMSELVRLNAVQAPYAITKGQRLVLPGPSGAGISREPAQPAVGAVASTPSAATPAPAAGTVQPSPGAATEGIGRQAQLAAIPQLPKRESNRFHWPVEGKVVARYGPRAGGQHNDGINILAPRGAAIQAAENGVVVYAGEELRGFGRLLLVKHQGGWVTAYAHADSLLVKRGQTVRRGQTIARVGSSGNIAKPQLHFEIRKGTRALNPIRLLTPRAASRSG